MLPCYDICCVKMVRLHVFVSIRADNSRVLLVMVKAGGELEVYALLFHPADNFSALAVEKLTVRYNDVPYVSFVCFHLFAKAHRVFDDLGVEKRFSAFKLYRKSSFFDDVRLLQ